MSPRSTRCLACRSTGWTSITCNQLYSTTLLRGPSGSPAPPSASRTQHHFGKVRASGNRGPFAWIYMLYCNDRERVFVVQERRKPQHLNNNVRRVKYGRTERYLSDRWRRRKSNTKIIVGTAVYGIPTTRRAEHALGCRREGDGEYSFGGCLNQAL